MHMKGAFMLLELLPAILLLAFVLTAALQVQVAAMRLADRAELKRRQEVAFVSVWAAWQESGGIAAMVDLSGDAVGEVREFPGSEWLPDTDPDRPSIHFRRRLEAVAGNRVWLVEAQLPRGGWEEWCWILGEPEAYPEAE